MSVSQQLFFCEAKNRARLGGAVEKNYATGQTTAVSTIAC